MQSTSLAAAAVMHLLLSSLAALASLLLLAWPWLRASAPKDAPRHKR